MTKYVVLFHSNGRRTVLVDQGARRDPIAVAKRAPSDVYGFVFCEADSPGQALSPSKRSRSSGVNYINGTVLDASALRALVGKDAIVLRNMLGNRYELMINMRTGGFWEYRKGTDHNIYI
jgi:hypothetical protein